MFSNSRPFLIIIKFIITSEGKKGYLKVKVVAFLLQCCQLKSDVPLSLPERVIKYVPRYGKQVKHGEIVNISADLLCVTIS